MAELGANYSIRDEIREFWVGACGDVRSECGTRDFLRGRAGRVHKLIRKHLGEGQGRMALDLASGTGVISHLMHDMGFKVTAPIGRRRCWNRRGQAKKTRRGHPLHYARCRKDAEPRGGYDVITNRHLVWTLVDAPAAFQEWFELLKPGGKLLIGDGNMGRKGWVTRLRMAFGGKPGHSTLRGHGRAAAADRTQVHFSGEMTAEAVVECAAGRRFVTPTIDRRLGAIHWPQARKMHSGGPWNA